MAYGANFLTGGTPTADDSTYGAAALAVDGSTTTYWARGDIGWTSPSWWKYDLGVGVTKIARKLRTIDYASIAVGMKAFKLQGSNDNSTWDDLLSTQAANDQGNWQEWTFVNSTPYRYYRVLITSGWYSVNDGQVMVAEFQMMELDLIGKISGVAQADILKVSSVENADINKVSGVANV